MDPILKAQLERDEGRRLVAYKDTNGNWTIGIGHLLGSSPRMSSITDAECDALFVADVEIAIKAIDRVFPEANLGGNFPHLIDARFRAAVNMAFNRGEEHMRQSTTITPAIRHALTVPTFIPAWEAVSYAILASPWCAQIGDRGKRLAKQFETGEDQ